MPSIDCKIDLILISSAVCVISSVTRKSKFPIIDTKLCIIFVPLPTQGNVKLLQQFKLIFKTKNNCSKCH